MSKWRFQSNPNAYYNYWKHAVPLLRFGRSKDYPIRERKRYGLAYALEGDIK